MAKLNMQNYVTKKQFDALKAKIEKFMEKSKVKKPVAKKAKMGRKKKLANQVIA